MFEVVIEWEEILLFSIIASKNLVLLATELKEELISAGSEVEREIFCFGKTK